MTDRRDNEHEAAAAGLHRLVEDRKRLVTTNVVLFELHSLLVNRINRQVDWDALVALRASQIIVRVRERDEARAEVIVDQYDDKDFSLTDALSFSVMERLGLRLAFSLGRHFAQYGWELVPLGEEAGHGS